VAAVEANRFVQDAQFATATWNRRASGSGRPLDDFLRDRAEQ
jgi:hypothetical protein